MAEDKSPYREIFLDKYPKGTEFILLDDEQGSHRIDGTVLFFDGISFLIFSSAEAFADHYFLDKHVPYQVCQYVGDKDESGEIIWHSIKSQNEKGDWYKKEISFPLDEIDTELHDTKVFTKPVQFN